MSRDFGSSLKLQVSFCLCAGCAGWAEFCDCDSETSIPHGWCSPVHWHARIFVLSIDQIGDVCFKLLNELFRWSKMRQGFLDQFSVERICVMRIIAIILMLMLMWVFNLSLKIIKCGHWLNTSCELTWTKYSTQGVDGLEDCHHVLSQDRPDS